jgi:hypothetical protein
MGIADLDHDGRKQLLSTNGKRNAVASSPEPALGAARQAVTRQMAISTVILTTPGCRA